MLLTLLLQLDSLGNEISPAYEFGQSVGKFLFGVLFFGVYFLPSFIAKNKRNKQSIIMLNFFLGWTVLGWIGALIWAMSGEAPAPQVIVAPPATTPALSVADEITKLRNLRDAGELTNEEFLTQKARLLRS